MLTTTATRLVPRARCSPRAISGNIAPTCSALIRFRGQQSRMFRFGRIWTSHLDPELHREVLRHHRKLRHKYAETLNRRLAWDNHPFADDAKRMLKSLIRDHWGKGLRPSGRYVNTDARCTTPGNPTGVRSDSNIEDVERGAMEHLLFRDRGSEEWTPAFRGPKHPARKQHLSCSGSSAASMDDRGSEVAYIIDPITNRKVPIKPPVADGPFPTTSSTLDSAAEKPAISLTGYQSQFSSLSPPRIPTSQEPIFSDGPPPESELKAYGPVGLDWHASKAAYHGQPNLASESQERENGHVEMTESKAVSWHRNEGIMSSASNISTKQGDGVNLWTINPKGFGYDDLDKYKHSTPTDIESHDDLQKYRPVVPEQVAQQQYPDLSSYDAFTYVEPDARTVAQELQADGVSKVNSQIFHQDESDARISVSNEPQPHPEELQRYQPFSYNEAGGKSAWALEDGHNYDLVEVRKYQAFRYNEPDGKPLESENMDGYDAVELEEYREIALTKRDADIVSESEVDTSGLRQYAAIKYDEPITEQTEQPDTAARALEELDKKRKAERWVPYLEPTEEERAEDLDLLQASDLRAHFGRLRATEPAESTPHNRTVLESLMSRHAATSDAEDQEAVVSVKEAKQKRAGTQSQGQELETRLTGNYVRDFPEEFARSWTSNFTPGQQTSASASGEVPLVQPALDRQGKAEKLQPALDRRVSSVAKQPVEDLFSKTPKELETATGNEGATKLEDTDAQAVTSSDAVPEPTLYKILAYDQTMQTIHIAETTSNVSKTEPPLTPAEVMLRLSNPANFFPHFGPLQAQGFEIVSGSGDVLVFRKVRDSAVDASPVVSDSLAPVVVAASSSSSSLASAEEPSSTPAPPLVNPIDMTGRPSRRDFPDPAIGRFASPTGFVNYEMPPAEAEPVAGRFVSGIDVRREEDVFSGEKKKGDEASGGRAAKAGLPKRVAIGAAWVAGVSYALGVVGEYFMTGGSDGTGPKGF